MLTPNRAVFTAANMGRHGRAASDDVDDDVSGDTRSAYRQLGLDMTSVLRLKSEKDAVIKVQKAWRRQLRVHHPDKNGGTSEATEQSKRLNNAKDVCLEDIHQHFCGFASEQRKHRSRDNGSHDEDMWEQPDLRQSKRAQRDEKEELLAAIEKAKRDKAANTERIRRQQQARRTNRPTPQ